MKNFKILWNAVAAMLGKGLEVGELGVFSMDRRKLRGSLLFSTTTWKEVVGQSPN